MIRNAPLLFFLIVFAVVTNAQEMKDYRSAGRVGRIRTLHEETAKLIDESGELKESRRVVIEESNFNERGEKLTIKLTHPDGKPWVEGTFHYEYDDQGRIRVMEANGPDGKFQEKLVNTFNKNGKVTNKAFFDKNGQPVFDLIYVYNEAGNVSRMQEGRRPGKVYFDLVYTYNSDGIEADRKDYSAEGSLTYRTVTNYDTSGKETGVITYNESGKIISRSQYTYDAKDRNNVTEVVRSGMGDIVQSREHYTYDEFDEKGNWIKRHTVREIARGSEIVKEIEITYRTFTYY